MKKPSSIICAATLFMALCLSPSCERGDGVPVRNGRDLLISADSLQSIRDAIGHHIACSRYDQADSLSHWLKRYGIRNENPKVYLTGIVYLAQLHYALQRSDSMNIYLNEALSLARELKDNWALATVYNVLGIYAMFNDMDYPRGISYLIEGVKFAESSGDNSRMFILKCNIALGYYLRNDPAGLSYALDVYEIGRKYANKYMVFSGAVASGYLYYLSGDYDKALEYTGQAVPLTEIYGDRSGVYSIYGDILLALGREVEAVDYYSRALTNDRFEGHYSSPIDAHLSYGAYLSNKKRHREAISIMEQAVEIMRTNYNPVKRYLLYRNISAAYDSIGDTGNALKYYKMYDRDADSLFNADKERSLGELKVKYEKERHENEVREHKIEMLHEQKKLQTTVLLCIAMLIAAVAGYILYYRTEKNYKSILKQHQEDKERERRFRIEKDAAASGEKPKYPPSMAPDKMEELFTKLQEVMSSQELYRRPDLNRDKVASILSTNRTYLTDVINKFTRLSFIYYVNSFRIDEAVRILSDPENDTPIKVISSDVGFTTLSTFYKFFQAATGMPPSQFRNRVKGD